MKTNFIEVCDVCGSVISKYELEDLSMLSRLTDGYLFMIEGEVMVQWTVLDREGWAPEENRVFVAKSEEERELLLNLDPVKVYLRLPDMTSSILNVNPYHSVRWLKKYIVATKQLTFDMKLIVNEQEMVGKNSLIQYVYENAIIHIIDEGLASSSDTIDFLYVKEPGKEAEVFEITQLGLQESIGSLCEKVSILLKIPEEFLYLVFTGRILNRKETVQFYSIKSGSYLYAVDGRKYMKVVSKSQYQQRVKEVRKKAEAITRLLQKKSEQKVVKEQQAKTEKVEEKKEIKKVYGEMDMDESDELNYFKNISDDDVLRSSQKEEDNEEVKNSGSYEEQVQKNQHQQNEIRKEEHQQDGQKAEKVQEQEEKINENEKNSQNVVQNPLSLFMSEKINILVDSSNPSIRSSSSENIQLSSKQSINFQPPQMNLGEGDFPVTIIDNDHKKTSVVINITDCIDDVIEKYAEVRSISSKKVQILLDGSVLEEYAMVNQLQISANTNLFALIKP